MFSYSVFFLIFSNDVFIFGCARSSVTTCSLSLVSLSKGHSVAVHRLLTAVASLVAEHRL